MEAVRVAAAIDAARSVAARCWLLLLLLDFVASLAATEIAEGEEAAKKRGLRSLLQLMADMLIFEEIEAAEARCARRATALVSADRAEGTDITRP